VKKITGEFEENYTLFTLSPVKIPTQTLKVRKECSIIYAVTIKNHESIGTEVGWDAKLSEFNRLIIFKRYESLSFR
jgi:hypothetical protein